MASTSKRQEMWNLSDMVSYLLDDEEISAGLTKDDLTSLHNPDLGFLQVLRGALEYQGFNPKAILREMIRRRYTYIAAQKEEIVWDLTNKEGEFRTTPASKASDCISSNGPLVKDIEILIFMFLHRNNHISKIIKKSLPGIASILEHLREKYDINDETRKSGTALGVSDITLPRIAGVMPAVAVKLFHARLVKETVPFLTIPGVKYDDEISHDTDTDVAGASGSKVSNITHAICCPFLPSLHPKAAKGPSHIHGIMLYVAIRLDDIIHRKEKDITCLEDLATYYRAGYDSPVTPGATRLEVMKRVGLIEKTSGEFSAEAKRINRACTKALESLRSEDPFHSTLLNMVRSGAIE
ncbi:unnamed protein product [Euphydryas editha]|uniref:Nucleocapsid protein n=1 Tax=Euphydryas editha TaxID=104508 RepID=A0AAU9UPL8_EUPED|nr:unnamed protein product [Euphydryas editha]